MRRILLMAAVLVVAVAAAAAGAAYWFFSRDGFRHALEAQATAWLGHPVRIGVARAQFLPRLAIQLGDIQVGDPAQLVLGDVELGADIGPLLSGRVENGDVLVSGSRIDMPLPFGLPRDGKGASEPAAAAVRIVSIRSIALRSVRLRSRDREIVVSADSSLQDSMLALRRFTAEAGGTTLSAEGAISLSPRVDARLKATANRLDVDELLALAQAFSPAPDKAAGEAPGEPARIVAKIDAAEASAAGIQARRLATELTVDGDSVALNPLRFELFGGTYDGTLTAQLGTQLSATLKSRVADVDVAQLSAFGGVPDTVTGRLRGEATVTGSGADMAQLLRDARGRGTVSIADGSIRRLQLVRTVVLFFGRPAPQTEEATDRFDRFDAEFSLANRVARAEAAKLHSRDADITGAGTLNLENDALDGRVDLLLSEALSAQAGTDLYRYTREGNRVVLPAAVGGTLVMPRITIDVGAAAKRGLRNELERRLKGLFEGLGP